MPLSDSDRISALENRQRAIESSIARLVEALNKCITADQVQQLEILNGTQLDFLEQQVQQLTDLVDLLRAQIYVAA